jgi:hypothetical protein
MPAISADTGNRMTCMLTCMTCCSPPAHKLLLLLLLLLL